MGRVTIGDVARRARVSPAAVSAAFNDPAQLSKTTVSRILATALRLGYAPNPHARALLSRRVGVLGVLFPQAVSTVFANPFFSAFLEGVGEITDERAVGLLTVSPAHGSLARAIAAAPVDGFVIVGLDEAHDEVAPLRRRGVPFVIVDGDSEVASSVNVDDEAGAYQAARFLLGQGHGDVLVLGFHMPPADLHQPRGVAGRRLAGYRRAFAEANVPLAEDSVVRTPVSLNGGDEALEKVLSRGRRPSALLAVSDIMALGAMRAARRNGLRVPEDLAVIGFDDIPLATASHPTLSTVHQPIREKGRVATRLLLRELDDSGPREQIVLPTELVLRETTSTGKAPLRREKGGSYRGRRTLTRAAAG
ncbi:MAG: LacI family transcriptional regulator [Chloroflexi bacterium]|nr:MAG: LacI family transcriptional regulator [Chloroflexota bacterium]